MDLGTQRGCVNIKTGGSSPRQGLSQFTASALEVSRKPFSGCDEERSEGACFLRLAEPVTSLSSSP